MVKGRTNSPSGTNQYSYRTNREKRSTRYAESLTDPKSNLKLSQASLGSLTAESVSKYLDSPESNLESIASLMETLRIKNGVIGRTIDYFKSLLTYNHTVYPTMNKKSGYEMPKGSMNLQEYMEAAEFISKYDIRAFAPYIVQEVLIGGTGYFYKIEDSKGIAYLQFPVTWGRIYTQSQGVYRWELDMSKIKDDLSVYMPKEIQGAMEDYKDSKKTAEWRDSKWYKLSDKAVAFCFNPNVLKNGGFAISEFASLLVDSFQYEKAKDNVQIKDDIDTIRLIHNKIPVDKQGVPIMSGDAAKLYDAALRKALPTGIASVTNPMDVENINLSGSGSTKSYSTLSEAQSQLFISTGTPSMMFGQETSSSKIVEMSVRKDSAWVFSSIVPNIEAYFNYEMSKYRSTSKMVWRMKFLRQTVYENSTFPGLMKDSVSVGGLRLDYLASIGYDPIEVVNKLLMEQNMLDIDSLMLPKQMSYTMSSKDTGRPTADDPTDDTERINDAK